MKPEPKPDSVAAYRRSHSFLVCWVEDGLVSDLQCSPYFQCMTCPDIGSSSLHVFLLFLLPAPWHFVPQQKDHHISHVCIRASVEIETVSCNSNTFSRSSGQSKFCSPSMTLYAHVDGCQLIPWCLSVAQLAACVPVAKSTCVHFYEFKKSTTWSVATVSQVCW